MRALAFLTRFSKPALVAEECRVRSVTALLRELILRIIAIPALDSRVLAHLHLLSVLLNEMSAAPVAPLMLPLPVAGRPCRGAACAPITQRRRDA
jgi:hypothetical protein